jgi:hypothetical protein
MGNEMRADRFCKFFSLFIFKTYQIYYRRKQRLFLYRQDQPLSRAYILTNSAHSIRFETMLPYLSDSPEFPKTPL